MAARTTPARRSGRPPNRAYIELMKPDEDWRNMADAAERRRIQNRLAQRAYRRNLRDRTREVENLKRQVIQLQSSESASHQPSRSPSPGLVSSPGLSISGGSSDGGRPGTPTVATGWHGGGYFPVEVGEPEHHVTGLGFMDFQTVDRQQHHPGHSHLSIMYHTAGLSPNMGSVGLGLPPCQVSPLMVSKRTFSIESMASELSTQSGATYPGSNGYGAFSTSSSISPTSSSHSPRTSGDGLFLTPQLVVPPGMTPPPTTPPPVETTYMQVPKLPSQASRQSRHQTQPISPSALAQYAISSGDLPSLRILLRDHPISLASSPDREGLTPLQRAVALGRPDMVSLFIEAFFGSAAVPAGSIRIGVEDAGETGRGCLAVHL